MPKYLVRALQPDGFWRGGLHFPADGREIDTEQLTEQQVKLIMGEKRMLLITEVQEKPEAPNDLEKDAKNANAPDHEKIKSGKGK